MTSKNRTFSDIDMGFTLNPFTKDVNRVYDVKAIKQAMKTIVLSNFYGRPFHPEYGCHVYELLFENNTPMLERAVMESIRTSLLNFEPRIEPNTLEITASFNDSEYTYNVTVEFTLRGLMQEITFDFLLERTR